jgi:hypothetical protein
MSSLGVAEFCAQSADLGAKHGAGRAAAMGHAFHAKCSGQKSRVTLTPEEQAEVDSWIVPTSFTLPDGFELRYSEFETEVELYLGRDGEFCSQPNAVSIGHMDLGYCRLDLETGKRVVYVGDIKRTNWTSKGPTSLQVLAYAHAYCGRKQADAYVPFIYVAETGEWQFGEKTFVDSEEYHDRRERLLFAIHNHGGEANTGPHCRDCWSRMHCPEHLLPAAAANTWLGAFTKPGADITPADAAEIKLRLQALGDLTKAVDRLISSQEGMPPITGKNLAGQQVDSAVQDKIIQSDALISLVLKNPNQQTNSKTFNQST